MLNIENSLTAKFPSFATSSPLIRKPTLGLIRKLVYEKQINDFLERNRNKRGIDFIESIFDYFNFSYSVTSRDRDNLPAQGRVVIIANHPIGSLDGLALLHLVSSVRRDVKIIANDMLMAFEPLRDLLLPLDNMTRRAYRKSYTAIIEALENEQAIIVFPAGEVSRAGPIGVRDGSWHAGFLHFARKTQAPLLPVHIAAKNSLLFYSVSALFKPLSTALLAYEMFNKRSAEIKIRVGETIPYNALQPKGLADKALVQRLKKQVYKVGKNRRALFVVEKTIAHPEDRGSLKQELLSAKLLGRTRDNHAIYMCDFHQHPVVMRELGRLRELAFRRVGEGTGRRRDIDDYDPHYHHLVLWDETQLAIAGAYRVGHTRSIIEKADIEGLYTAELFDFQPHIRTYLQNGVELGRSFVNPNYWGRASLDYLWQGLGAYLRNHPDVRYLLGPVSMSASFPQSLRDLLVLYFTRYYRFDKQAELARPKHPYVTATRAQLFYQKAFSGLDRDQAFELVQQEFSAAGYKVPALFKHYAAVFEPGGYSLLNFSVDSEFGHCVDGLFLGDLHQMKQKKWARYIGE